MSNILLCCDLDRTVLPNGNAIESPGVRDVFAHVVQHAGLTLAYVSGRDIHLLQQAIDEFQIPLPDYAIGDVGTTLYQIKQGSWQAQTDWADHIGEDWQQQPASTLQQYLEGLPALRLQEPEKQNIHKLSYICRSRLSLAISGIVWSCIVSRRISSIALTKLPGPDWSIFCRNAHQNIMPSNF